MCICVCAWDVPAPPLNGGPGLLTTNHTMWLDLQPFSEQVGPFPSHFPIHPRQVSRFPGSCLTCPASGKR